MGGRYDPEGAADLGARRKTGHRIPPAVSNLAQSSQSQKDSERPVDSAQCRIIHPADYRADPLATRGLRLIDLDLRGMVEARLRADRDAEQRRVDQMACDGQHCQRRMLVAL